MKISLKVAESMGTRIKILVNDEIKYIVDFSVTLHKITSIKDCNGKMAFSIETDNTFSYMMKHHYTFLSENKKISIVPNRLKDGFREYTISNNENQMLKVMEHLNKRYTHYPIYLNGIEIAEGLLINESKNFTIDFNVFLLDTYENYMDEVCLFCAVLFSTYLVGVLSPNKTFYGAEISFNTPELAFNPGWLKENFNVNL